MGPSERFLSEKNTLAAMILQGFYFILWASSKLGRSSWSDSLIFFLRTQQKVRQVKPICSMYGIVTYIYLKNDPNVGKYTSTIEHLGKRNAILGCHFNPRLWRISISMFLLDFTPIFGGTPNCPIFPSAAPIFIPKNSLILTEAPLSPISFPPSSYRC